MLKDVLKEAFNRPREVHAFWIAFSINFLGGFIELQVLGFSISSQSVWSHSFALGIVLMGGQTLVDMVPSPRLKQVLRAFLKSRTGMELRYEIPYFFGGLVSGVVVYKIAALNWTAILVSIYHLCL